MNLYLRITPISLLLFLIQFGGAQPIGTNGLIPDDEAYEQIPLLRTEQERGDCKYPFQESLRPYCPTPGDQEGLPSCVGWALANALTIQKAIRQENKDRSAIDQMQHSAAYIYNQINDKGICHLGAYLKDGLDLLKKNGDCLASSLNYSPESCKTVPQRNHHREAARFRIANYYILFKLDEKADNKLEAIMCELAEKKPVIVRMTVPANFRQTDPATLAEWKKEDDHLMVVVGYNEFKKTFELMNSYGPSWGDGGFLQVSFETMAQNVKYGLVLELGEKFGRR